MAKVLVIGSSGQIGVELIEKLAKIYGSSKIIASDIHLNLNQNLQGVTYLKLDVLDKIKLLEVIKKYDISEVYLLAALLSAVAERNIQLAWDLNMKGLFHILDLAKEKYIKKIFWPSSIAVFGPTSPKLNTPQTTILDPSTVYGISKMSGERWCEYYFLKYGVDVRSLRYPGIISYKSPPGGGTTDYVVEMLNHAKYKKKYICPLIKDLSLPMMHVNDAVDASIKLMSMPRKNISISSSYNISSFETTPIEWKTLINEISNELEVQFRPDFRQKIAESWPRKIDDRIIRKDLNWRPMYDKIQTLRSVINKL